MARRKSGGGSTLLLVIIFALAFLGPIVIVVAWVYFEWASRQLGADDEVTSESERLQAISGQLSNELEALFGEGDAAGLYRRADQLFDGRTNLGRSLNTDIEYLLSQRDECYTQLATLHETGAKAKGARVAVLTLIIAFAGLYFRNPQMGFIFQSAIASAAAIAIGYFWYRAQLAG